MVSIHHEKELIFIHIPKTGGTYINQMLKQYYGFEFYILKRRDHDTFCKIPISYYKNIKQEISKLENVSLQSKLLNEYQWNPMNRTFGFYQYYSQNYDKSFQEKMKMSPIKWQRYKKFCFMRNPYERFISGFNFLKEKWGFAQDIDFIFSHHHQLSDYQYNHLLFPQYKHICDHNNKIVTHDIGRFSHLEEDFQSILKKYGFSIRHIPRFINKSKNTKTFYNYILNDYSLQQLNNVLSDLDFQLSNTSRVVTLYPENFTHSFYKYSLVIQTVLLLLFLVFYLFYIYRPS
jgi:hypothetical protein